MTINNYLNLSDDDIRNMSREQLVELVNKGRSWSNSRRNKALETFEDNTNYPTPIAYRELDTTDSSKWKMLGLSKWKSWKDVDFTAIGKTKNASNEELINAIMVYRQFLSTKTSTASGWRKHLTEFKRRAGINPHTRITDNRFKEFWKIYNAFQSNYRAMADFKYETSSDSKQLLPREIQGIIWRSMTEVGKTPRYDELKSFDEDIYGNKVLQLAIEKIDAYYNNIEEEKRVKQSNYLSSNYTPKLGGNRFE